MNHGTSNTLIADDDAPMDDDVVRRLRDLQAGDDSVRIKLAACHEQLLHLGGEGRNSAVFQLARLVESRTDQSDEQLARACDWACQMAADLGGAGPYAAQIDQPFLSDFSHAALLHDIGNAALPDAILLKPGRLSPDEFELMKQHTVIGSRMLTQAPQRSPHSLLTMAAQVALCHHERWDGLGYPQGLAGEEIPLAARIFSVADVFDALISQRPYQTAFPPQIAEQIIEDGAGKQFDPLAVAAFCRLRSPIQGEKSSRIGG